MDEMCYYELQQVLLQKDWFRVNTYLLLPLLSHTKCFKQKTFNLIIFMTCKHFQNDKFTKHVMYNKINNIQTKST